jgi:hypothetical protein
MLLEQVFLSLLGNALEALPEGEGTITIHTGVRQNGNGITQIFAEVRDSGPGIPPDSLSKIFEPFYTTKAQGTAWAWPSQIQGVAAPYPFEPPGARHVPSDSWPTSERSRRRGGQGGEVVEPIRPLAVLRLQGSSNLPG